MDIMNMESEDGNWFDCLQRSLQSLIHMALASMRSSLGFLAPLYLQTSYAVDTLLDSIKRPVLTRLRLHLLYNLQSSFIQHVHAQNRLAEVSGMRPQRVPCHMLIDDDILEHAVCAHGRLARRQGCS